MRKENSFSEINHAMVYLLQVLVMISLMSQRGNIRNSLLCILTLLLFEFPHFIKHTLPKLLEMILYCFIFSAIILGEVENFYNIWNHWDTILHTVNGFICAMIGFSLLKDKIQNPILIIIMTLSFSMTVGVIWEIAEFTVDQCFLKDMQKDKIITSFKSNKINESLKDIIKTEIFLANGNTIEIDGYLDIGLHDTMKDLMVNLIGAVIFSLIGYQYLTNKDQCSWIKKIIEENVIV